MNLNDNILFNISGCLSNEGLHRYISGELSSNEIKPVEEHLAACELCKDACEGVKLYGNKNKDPYAGMKNDIDSRIRFKKSAKQRKRRIAVSTAVTIAATLILFFGVFYTFEEGRFGGDRYLAYNQNSPVIPLDSIRVIPIKVKLTQPISELTDVKPMPLKAPRIALKQSEKQHLKQLVKHEGHADSGISAEAGSKSAETVKTASVSRTMSATVQYALVEEREPEREFDNERKPETERDKGAIDNPHVTYVAKSNRYTQAAEDKEAERAVEESDKAKKKEMPEQDKALTKAKIEEKSSSRFVNSRYPDDKLFKINRKEPATLTFPDDLDHDPVFNVKNYNSFSEYITLRIQERFHEGGILSKEIRFKFIIDERGVVIEPEVLKGGTSAMNEAVMEILEASPEWQPGMKDSVNVSVNVIVSIRFD